MIRPKFTAMTAISALALSLVAMPVTAQNADRYPDINNMITDEGMNRSQVMQLAHELVDGIGGRLTNSPQIRQAESWAIGKFESWGLSNVRREGFVFGRGWSMNDYDVRMVSPRAMQLTAIPVAWTPPTNGTVTAPVFVAPISEKEHFEAYRGKLAGKIVMVSLPGTGDEPTTAPFRRLDSSDIAKRDSYDMPEYDPEADDRRIERVVFAEELDAFLKAEGAVAMVKKSYRDGKLVHGTGYAYLQGRSHTLPAVEMAAEDYRRLARMAKSGDVPVISVNSDVQFHDDDMNAYNIIAEIPGTDPGAGYVMAGAHYDSWVAGDGAADNASGTVAVMEAARILAKSGKRPKRTIRFALWSGEEQGLLGSLAYTEKYLATRPAAGANAPSPTFGWTNRYPITPRPGYYDLKAYFNIDNGSGKLRGIHAEGNSAAVPLLRKWLAPFAAMGAGNVVAGDTGGTDHVFMQSIGVPGFQFIQDPLDYFARLHHTNADTFDHLKPDDLRQASVVLAGVLWAAANDKETLPRQPLPRQPLATDPYKYRYPGE